MMHANNRRSRRIAFLMLTAAGIIAPAAAQDSIDLEATTPALPGLPEYTVRSFRSDGFAARSLAAEADDPPWSIPMEARIRALLADGARLDISRVEVECRTTRCGLLAVHSPDADRTTQSDLLAHIQSEGPGALGFDGSMAASFGQTGTTRYTALYFEGFRNLGPPLPLPVWLLAFGLAHDPQEQLLVGEEIVQARSTLALRWIGTWLDAVSISSRANAAYILARYDDPRGVATLESIVSEFAGPSLLGGEAAGATTAELDHAAYLLGILGDPGSFATLWRILEGPMPNDYPSRAVERALLQTVDASAIPFLIRQLDGRDDFLRAMAIQILAELGAREALPHLETLLNDPARPFRGSTTSIGDLAWQARAIIGSTPVDQGLRAAPGGL